MDIWQAIVDTVVGHLASITHWVSTGISSVLPAVRAMLEGSRPLVIGLVLLIGGGICVMSLRLLQILASLCALAGALLLIYWGVATFF